MTTEENIEEEKKDTNDEQGVLAERDQKNHYVTPSKEKVKEKLESINERHGKALKNLAK